MAFEHPDKLLPDHSGRAEDCHFQLAAFEATVFSRTNYRRFFSHRFSHTFLAARRLSNAAARADRLTLYIDDRRLPPPSLLVQTLALLV
jgi:hypothetical protein